MPIDARSGRADSLEGSASDGDQAAPVAEPVPGVIAALNVAYTTDAATTQAHADNLYLAPFQPQKKALFDNLDMRFDCNTLRMLSWFSMLVAIQSMGFRMGDGFTDAEHSLPDGEPKYISPVNAVKFLLGGAFFTFIYFMIAMWNSRDKFKFTPFQMRLMLASANGLSSAVYNGDRVGFLKFNLFTMLTTVVGGHLAFALVCDAYKFIEDFTRSGFGVAMQAKCRFFRSELAKLLPFEKAPGCLVDDGEVAHFGYSAPTAPE